MKKQITRIAVHQSSKVIAAMYIIFTLPFALIGVIGMMFGAPSKFPFAFFAMTPIIYGIIGYLFFALFCWLYNILASRIGGIEYETKEIYGDGGFKSEARRIA
ncbi:hypothetical protein [Thiomonas sp.]